MALIVHGILGAAIQDLSAWMATDGPITSAPMALTTARTGTAVRRAGAAAAAVAESHATRAGTADRDWTRRQSL
jgi:hypothetical protein